MPNTESNGIGEAASRVGQHAVGLLVNATQEADVAAITDWSAAHGSAALNHPADERERNLETITVAYVQATLALLE